MIIAEITPTAQQIIPITPFSSETVSLTHMIVWCKDYTPGSDDNIFTTQFGVPKYNSEGIMNGITIGAQQNVPLTQAELSTWGSNDESLYTIVANTLGLTITSFTIT